MCVANGEYSMEFLKVLFCFSVFLGCVSAAEDSLLPEPCDLNDIPCWSRSTQTFLEKTCKGIPEYDIKAIDPLIIPSLEETIDDLDIKYTFRNINVTGLKNQQISQFKMDVAKKDVLLKTKVDALKINADITIQFTKLSKTFSGTYTAVANVLGTARYPYSERTDEKGDVYIDVGPETISCESVDEPVASLNDQLIQTLYSEPDVKKICEKYVDNKSFYRRNTVCRIVDAAYINVVHNIRASARILPKSAFFKNL